MSKARDIARAGTALSSVDATELGYLDGVTSNLQTQIDNKAAFPSQTGNSGKYLTTDGTSVSWGSVSSPILSVNYGQRTAGFSTTSGAWVDVTGMTVTITPKSASSKFIIFVATQFNVKNTANGYAQGQILRNSTVLTTFQQGGVSTTFQQKLSWTTIYVDSPATTAATTYKFQVLGTSLELEGASAITVLEI